MSTKLELYVKLSTDAQKLQVSVDSDQETVLQLKERLASLTQIPADQQRLIYSGKVLKDADALSVYKLATGHTIHLVKGAGASSTTAARSTAQPAAPTATPAPAPASTPAANPFTGNPFAAAFGGMGGMGAAGAAGLNNAQAPGSSMFMQQMMQQMLQNPVLMEQMMAANPMMQQMGISGEQMRMMLQDPMVQSMLSNPQLMASMMQQQQGQGMFPGMFPGAGAAGMTGGAAPSSTSPTAATGTDANAAAGLPPLPGPFMMPNPMLAQLLAGGAGGGLFGNPAAATAQATSPQEPPEVRFQIQLQQLQDMGFFDGTKNVRALLATGGNVHAAVEWLFNNP